MHAYHAVVEAILKLDHLAYRDFLIGFVGGLVCVVNVGAIVQAVFHWVAPFLLVEARK